MHKRLMMIKGETKSLLLQTNRSKQTSLAKVWYWKKCVRVAKEDKTQVLNGSCATVAHRVFWPKIHFTPRVSWLGGQVGHQKKRNSSRNWLFFVWCATLQPKLSKLSKTTQNGHFLALFWTFLKIVQFWLKSSARNQEKSMPWISSLLLMSH